MTCWKAKLSNRSPIEMVIDGRKGLTVFRPGAGWSDEPPNDALMLAGSFRPLHRAHRALLTAGWEVTGKRLTRCFEISIQNVEKPEIASSEVEARLGQFRCEDDIVVITKAATFVEKARLMPGTTFAIGYDTAVRLFDDRFYEGSTDESPTLAVLRELKELGSGFVIGGRHDEDGDFKTFHDLTIPHGLESLFLEIPEWKFSDPISSTQLRRSDETP